MPLFEQQFILDKTMRRIYDTWRIIFGVVWDSYSMKMKNWSVNKQRSLVSAQLISKNLRGCWQAYCAAGLIGSPTPKPTCSPTLFSVWQKWKMILLRPGRAKFNGSENTSRIWTESTVCRRCSGGEYSQESQRWAFSNWRVDGWSSGKPATTDESQQPWEFSESESWSDREKDVTGKLVVSRNSGNSESSKAGSRKWPQIFHMSPASVLHMETSLLDRTRGLWPKTNRWIEWPLREQRCIGEKHACHTSSRSSSWSRLYGETTIYQESVPKVSETVLPSDWEVDHGSDRKSVVWPRLILKNLRGDRRLYFVTKRLRLRMPKPMSSSTRCSVWEVSVTNKSKPGRTKSNCIWKISFLQDGEPMEFEWKIFPGFTTLGILEEIQQIMIELQCEPEQFVGRIIFMSMYNDIIWRERGNTETCETNSVTVANYAHRFPLGRWSFLGPGSEKKWSRNPRQQTWWRLGENCWRHDAPLCRKRSPCVSSPWKEENLEATEREIILFHFNGSEETMELVLRTIISVNQLSIYGAAADFCKQLSKVSEVAGKPAANEDLESMEMPSGLPVADPHTNAELQGNLLRMKIWNQWKCLQDFLLLILTPTRSCRETCCEIMNINSKTR